MEATLHSLGEIVLRGLPTFLLLVLLHFYLKRTFFAPLDKVLAARYEATLYCMDRFAGSDVIWADGVLQDADTLVTTGGLLIRNGRCVQR